MGKKLIIILTAVIIILGASFLFWSLNGEQQDTRDSVVQESKTTECPELNLIIEKAECRYNNTGIDISVFRRQDSLGVGKLTIYATDINNENQTISRQMNSSETARFLLGGAVAGSETTIFTELEITKNNSKLICRGPTQTYSCISEEPEFSDESVPLPAGEITAIDQRDDTGKGYFCNNVTNPEHRIRVYTYKNIGGVRNLSAGYIESSQVKNVCNNYADSNTGIYYNIKWKWAPVEGINGYRIYQYYALNSTTAIRDYTYYVEIGTLSSELTDTGLNLWRLEK